METSEFVHLHVHTQFSLLDGAATVKNLVQKAVEYNMPALAMTDHGNMFGAVNFYRECTKNNIKPIIGVEAYVSVYGTRLDKSPRNRATSHLILWAQNNEGYSNLLKLVSAGYLEGFYYNPRMDKDLLSKHAKGIIGSSACLRGEVAWHLREGNYEAACKSADDFSQIFGKGNFYLELMDHGIAEQKRVNEGLVKISKELNLPVVATNDVHYMSQSQAAAHDALLCIQSQAMISDEKRMRLGSDQFYFKDPQSMKDLFAWAPDAIKNTLEIAQRCSIEMDFDKIHLPRFDPPDQLSKLDYLRKLCEDNLPNRYEIVTDEIRERLAHEIKVIEDMGFIAYFLIVWDFIRFAKSHGIPVGPGRGSAAGSIVSYLLEITNLDPLEYDLLFERFLNKDRAGMPDIDIDFCYERRGEVIDYVTEKYGEKNVAQIITFGTMSAKAVLRDVGRVMGVPYGDVDRIAKLVPLDIGITLTEALEKEPQLKQLCMENDSAARIMETSLILEGLTRHASTHAAGVVISDKPLDEYVPLFKTSDGQITTGFTMNDVAQIGLLKMDFLGLRTLTVIQETIELIKEIRKEEVDIDSIVLNDEKTYQLLGAANSFGVFQLESSGMRDLLKKIKPSEFEDIIAILALYRPGPMGSGMLDDYIKRKRGDDEIKYDHPTLEPILKETYGIILYQEQVMKIPVVLAGFTLLQADHLRRAMSKKIQSVMGQMRKDFVAGCHKTSGLTQEKANYIFDLIDYFSGYGFNKSHSAAYALISYQTAYLKANYPVEFMCALLNSERNNTDKVVEYVKEAENMGIKVLPPDVNESDKLFKVTDENTIRFGLLALKNVGSGAIDSIVEHRRKEGEYSSLHDLCERVDLRSVNRKVLESLIKSGALDSFDAFRSQLMALVEVALEVGANTQKEKAAGQFSFFDMGGTDSGFSRQSETLPDIKEWPTNQLLAFEKEILGFYISGHPLSHYDTEIKEFTDMNSRRLQKAVDGEDVRLVGLIQYVKLTNTRKSNERMAIVKLEDKEGVVEIVVFPSAYVNLANYLKEGEVVFVKGKANKRDDETKIIVDSMYHIHEVYGTIKSINVDLSRIKSQKEGLDDLKQKLSHFPGKVPVYLRVSTKSQKSVQIVVSEDLFVTPNEELMNDIKELVGNESFSVSI